MKLCICADPENCTQAVPGYRCRKGEAVKPSSAVQASSEGDPFFQPFDCHYDGDINRCDKDCRQLGECKRRTTGTKPASSTPCSMSGIYVASRVKQAEVWKAYRARGWKINSTWIDEAGEGQTADFGELWERIRGEIARSHCLVFYAAGVEDFPFKGALVEVGMALAMGKQVFAVLENVMVEGRTMRPVGSWLLDRNVTRYDTLEEAMEIARGVDILCKPHSANKALSDMTLGELQRLHGAVMFELQQRVCGDPGGGIISTHASDSRTTNQGETNG